MVDKWRHAIHFATGATLWLAGLVLARFAVVAVLMAWLTLAPNQTGRISWMQTNLDSALVVVYAIVVIHCWTEG